jgi:hypothetical protein
VPLALAAATSLTYLSLCNDQYCYAGALPDYGTRGYSAVDALLLGLPRLRKLGLHAAPRTLWVKLKRAKPALEQLNR